MAHGIGLPWGLRRSYCQRPCQRPREAPLFLVIRNVFEDFRTVAKPELGTKRPCGSCGAKFYDLSKDPIVCPKCGTVFEIVVPVARGRAAEAAAAAAAGAAAAAAAAAKAKEAEVEVPETADVELVSLEDAD